MEISDNPRDLIHLWKLLVHVMYCIKKIVQSQSTKVF